MAKKADSSIKAAARAAAQKHQHNKNDCIVDMDTLVEPEFAKGEIREYLITNQPETLIEKRTLKSKEYWLLSSLLAIAMYVRLYHLSYPNSVVFDEVHFGGFARKYILGKFFMDVHPPLAKMLFAAVGALGGFKGDFEFKSIGDAYPETTPYIFMRQFPALLGVGTVLLCYLTLRQSGVRPIIAYITSFLLLIENSNITLSRYILLDSPLIFFIAAAVYSWKKFEIQIPFTLGWYRGLIATGIALGLAFSSKWVGLFTIAWVGFLCVYQMWFIIGDLSLSPRKVLAHFFARGAILLGVPFILYLTFFAIHFQVLDKEGDGSSFLPSAFRAGLKGNKIPRDIPAQVGLGSIVTIRHLETSGGYLHSHPHFYETGSKQQQITLYPHLDTNNKWFIEPYSNKTIYNETFVPLTNGIKIRLRHLNTGRRLHSHDEKAPVSERDWQKEASCYGYDGFEGDANDDFVVEIVKHRTKNEEAKQNVRAIETIFRLRHAMTGHYLFSSTVKLPDWGFGQQEVTAASQGRRGLTYWYIETNENPYLNQTEVEIVNYPVLSLWDKFVMSHKRMWQINQGLNSHHPWQSDPQDWPFLLRGINYWNKEHRQVYLLGNAVTWWTATACILTFFVYAGITVLRWHLGQPLSTEKNVFNFNVQVFSYILGWFLHYFPFFIMGRQLFLHHYIPALYFGILTLGHFLEIFTGYLTSRSKTFQRIALGVVFVFTGASVFFYLTYSPLIYGTPWTQDACTSAQPFKGWDFACSSFYKNLSEYDFPEVSSQDGKPSIPTETVLAQAKQTPGAKKVVAKPPPAPKIDTSVKKEKEQEKKVVAKEEEKEEIAPQAAVEFEVETPKNEEQKPAEQVPVADVESENEHIVEDDVPSEENLDEAIEQEPVVEDAAHVEDVNEAVEEEQAEAPVEKEQDRRVTQAEDIKMPA
ncbi:PMT1 [[Candida] subhashii]|uniref:Dolichyl-phosphate-mannose--protein mannosyltransferase n=1 Tax=[Candida] subhashii TaxID=561895 RepID=A0A8J5QKT8_9ASCO|nr:PMT1 [[Candida] subhashii]KAG7664917.1 PMT1 [[Candida] subhashii]